MGYRQAYLTHSYCSIGCRVFDVCEVVHKNQIHKLHDCMCEKACTCKHLFKHCLIYYEPTCVERYVMYSRMAACLQANARSGLHQLYAFVCLSVCDFCNLCTYLSLFFMFVQFVCARCCFFICLSLALSDLSFVDVSLCCVLGQGQRQTKNVATATINATHNQLTWKKQRRCAAREATQVYNA